MSDKKNSDQFHEGLNAPVKGVSLGKDAWRRLKKNKMAVAGLFVICFYTLIVFIAPLLPLHSYKEIVTTHNYLRPSLKPAKFLMYEKKEKLLLITAENQERELTAEEKQELVDYKQNLEVELHQIGDDKNVLVNERVYPLGTDYLGRDMLARVIYGGRISILIGLIGAVTSMLIGVAIGAMAGYIGGKFDSIVMRIVDVMYSLPYMLLVIIFMALFKRSNMNLFLALAIVSWLTVCRVVRGQIISLKNSEFVEAARASGVSTMRIIFRHLVPNTSSVIIIYTTLRVPAFIMLEAFLSYLGLGISAPETSWGLLINEGVAGMRSYPHMLWIPAIAMVLFLFSMNFVGDGLRDAFDPQSKNKI